MIKYYIAKLFRKLVPTAIKGSKIDKKAHISAGNTILYSEIGRYSYTSYDTQILYATIGKFCSIGSDCKIGGAGHPMHLISTSPTFYSRKNVFHKKFAEHVYEPYIRTYIGNDVWIGQNVLVKSGVSIGDGAVIGMGSVVTKNVGPYEVWAGNPAKFIRYRFDEEVRDVLTAIEWWKFDDEKLNEFMQKFHNPAELVKYYKKYEA